MPLSRAGAPDVNAPADSGPQWEGNRRRATAREKPFAGRIAHGRISAIPEKCGRIAVIASILDNDLYKFTMQQAVLELFPQAAATYEFINRRESDRFDERFFRALLAAIGELPRLRLQPAQRRSSSGAARR